VELFAAGGAQLVCDHPAYGESIDLPAFTIAELLADLRP
jgi:hypothetical protein